jgi:hypothetical protein
MNIRMMVDPTTHPSISGMTSYIANRYWYTDLMSGSGNTYTYTAQYGFGAADIVGVLASVRLGYISSAWVLDANSSASGTVLQSGTLTESTGSLNAANWAGVSAPSPTITSFTPTSTGQGGVVSITGTNFSGVTNVSFGGVSATYFNVVNSTTITAAVGSGASGNVSVTALGGTVVSSGFTL